VDDELASFFSDQGDDAADEVDNTDDASLLLAEDAPDADDEAVEPGDDSEDLEASERADEDDASAELERLRAERATWEQERAERDRLEADRLRQQEHARQTLRQTLLNHEIQRALAELPDLEPGEQRQRVLQIARAAAEPAHEEAQRQRGQAESAAKVAAAIHLAVTNVLGEDLAGAVMASARELLHLPDLGRMEGHLAARRGQTLAQENAELRRKLKDANLRQAAKQRQASGKDRVARGAPAKPAKPRVNDIDALWEEFASSPEMRAVFGD